MQRRDVMRWTAASAFVAPTALAAWRLLPTAKAGQAEQPSPGVLGPAGRTLGEVVRPYQEVRQVEGEGDVVRVFFSPSCGYSRAYLGFFRNLRATLPAHRRFALSAVVNQGDGVGYALAFEAVSRFYPAHVDNFVEASMLGVQDHGMGPSNWAAIERFGRAARLPRPLPGLVGENQAAAMAAVRESMRLRQACGVTNTPSVVVAGTYVATPEFASGDAQAFSQLVNGLISMTG